MDDVHDTVQATPRPLTAPRPSLLVRAAVYTLIPILVVAALPLLLLIIMALYLLALLQGGRVFFYSWSGTATRASTAESDLPKPYILEKPDPGKALPDESQKPGP